MSSPRDIASRVNLFFSHKGVFMDDAAGLRDSDVVYTDTNSEQIESIPENAVHRPVDSAIAGADKEGLSAR
jgi:hypothetical protein